MLTEQPATRRELRRRASGKWVQFKRAVVRIFDRQRTDHVVYLAASLAYFSLLALVPLSAISLSLFASFVDQEQNEIFEKVLDYIFPFDDDLLVIRDIPFDASPSDNPDLNPPGREEMLARLKEVRESFFASFHGFINQARGLGPIGLVFLLITGFWLFDSIEDAFNTIWRSEKRRPFLRRFSVFCTVLITAPILMVGPVFVNHFIESRESLANLEIVWRLLPYFLTWFAFWLMYMLVPHGNVDKRAAAVSAFLAALLWELAKRLFAEYVVRAEAYQTIYSGLVVVIFVLAWIYYTWWLLLLGFEICAYLQYPDWDRKIPYGDLAPEIGLLYSWGALFHTGRNFLEGKGGTKTQSISSSLGMDQINVVRILDRMEEAGILVRDVQGNWYPSVPLERITWAEVADRLDYDIEDGSVSLSDWFDSALRARGVVEYRQDVEQLPTLDSLLKQRLSSKVAEVENEISSPVSIVSVETRLIPDSEIQAVAKGDLSSP